MYPLVFFFVFFLLRILHRTLLWPERLLETISLDPEVQPEKRPLLFSEHTRRIANTRELNLNMGLGGDGSGGGGGGEGKAAGTEHILCGAGGGG